MTDIEALQIAAFCLETRYLGYGSESAMTSTSNRPTMYFRFNPRARPFIPGAFSHPPIPTEVFKTFANTSLRTFVFNPTAPVFYPRRAEPHLFNPFGIDEQSDLQSYTPPPVYHENPAGYCAASEEPVGFDSFYAHSVPVCGLGYATGAENLIYHVPIYTYTPVATLPPYTLSPGYDVLPDYLKKQPIHGAGYNWRSKNKRSKSYKTYKTYKAKHAERLRPELAEEFRPTNEW